MMAKRETTLDARQDLERIGDCIASKLLDYCQEQVPNFPTEISDEKIKNISSSLQQRIETHFNITRGGASITSPILIDSDNCPSNNNRFEISDFLPELGPELRQSLLEIPIISFSVTNEGDVLMCPKRGVSISHATEPWEVLSSPHRGNFPIEEVSVVSLAKHTHNGLDVRVAIKGDFNTEEAARASSRRGKVIKLSGGNFSISTNSFIRFSPNKDLLITSGADLPYLLKRNQEYDLWLASQGCRITSELNPESVSTADEPTLLTKVSSGLKNLTRT